jgi:RNA polymerase sigma factor (sigma-70 family)
MTEEATVPAQRSVSAEEQALLRRLRSGEDEAFSELFELHAGAVRRLARGIASDSSEAEDITAETFFRVLQALRRGSGPRDHVRAYLLTVARRVSWEWHGARRDVPVTDDELTHHVGAGADAHARTAEYSLIATAFTSLPERWRSVLWQTEVEGEQPAVVAPHFGLSANATAALARRARQGLRAAYLQAHLAMNRTSDVGCRGVIEKLGGYTAGSVTGSEARRIRTHLISCASCRSMHAELRDVCSSLRAHAGMLALLVPGTAAAAGVVSGSGVATTIKGLLLSKLKIGIALASTAAAGVVGIAVGPALMDSQSQAIDLPQGGVELAISPPSSLLSAPPSQPGRPDEATLRLPGQPARPGQRGGTTGQSSPSSTPAPATAFTPPPSTPASEHSSSGQPAHSSGVEPRDDTGTQTTTTGPSKGSATKSTTYGTEPSDPPGRSRSDHGADPGGHVKDHASGKPPSFWWFPPGEWQRKEATSPKGADSGSPGSSG